MVQTKDNDVKPSMTVEEIEKNSWQVILNSEFGY